MSPVDAGRSVRGARYWAVHRLRGKGKLPPTCLLPYCASKGLFEISVCTEDEPLKLRERDSGKDVARADGKFERQLLEVFRRGLPKVRLGKQTGTSVSQGLSGAEFGSIEVRSLVDNIGRVFARDCSGVRGDADTWRKSELN